MNRSGTRLTARLMLMLAALQFVFVALEATGVAHGVANEAHHHENLLSETEGGQHENDLAGKDLSASPNVDSHTCEYCHHCSGHGSHLAAVSGSHYLPAECSAAHSNSDQPNLQSIIIHSIHRPPIA